MRMRISNRSTASSETNASMSIGSSRWRKPAKSSNSGGSSTTPKNHTAQSETSRRKNTPGIGWQKPKSHPYYQPRTLDRNGTKKGVRSDRQILREPSDRSALGGGGCFGLRSPKSPASMIDGPLGLEFGRGAANRRRYARQGNSYGAGVFPGP